MDESSIPYNAQEILLAYIGVSFSVSLFRALVEKHAQKLKSDSEGESHA